MVLEKNIKEFCAEQKSEIKSYIEASKTAPVLAVIQVGDVEASNRYIKNKKKDCEEVGIKFEWYHFDEDIDTEGLVFEIENLLPHVDGLMVQMPLPEHIDVNVIKTAISPEKDVDGFHPNSFFRPCTPLGILDYLTLGCHYELEGKNVMVIGRSDIVGKPLASMLTDLDATVTLCHSKTRELYDFIFTADLIICAVGKANFLNCYSIYKPVIDVGINFDENGKLVGDCFNTENRDVTPVPGGVGLLTRVALLKNVMLAAKANKKE
jgi:methylenetetrahydrofolate dehydrogenase (NADP+)/methenyltetrahydrofolate cyclohydrolase